MEQNTNQNYSNDGQKKNKGMGVLSYIGILALIPYFSCKNDQWVRSHATQGLNLWLISFIVSIVLGFVSGMLAIIPEIGGVLSGLLGLVSSIISIGFLVLQILGIIAAAKGEYKDLPIVSKIKIIK